MKKYHKLTSVLVSSFSMLTLSACLYAGHGNQSQQHKQELPDITKSHGHQGLELSRISSFELELAIDEAFYLFTPIGEMNWAKGFEPVFFQGDTSPKRGRVFSTLHAGALTLWQITDYDPQHHKIAYSRVTPGKDVALITVELKSLAANKSRVSVRYDYTSISTAGDNYVRSMDKHYEEYIRSWEKLIVEYLASQE